MKNGKRLMGLSLRNERGAALIAVFLILMVLVTLGMGAMALSISSAKQATVTDTYEKAYYVAEGGAQQGIEYIKGSVLRLYNDIKADVKLMQTEDTTKNSASDFFSKMDLRIATFTPQEPDKTAQSGIQDLDVTITSSGTGNTRIYEISSTATGSGTFRQVLGRITVNFVKVKLNTVSFGQETLFVGGTLVRPTRPYTEVTGTVKVGGYNNGQSSSTYGQYDKFVLEDMNKADVSTWIDPAAATGVKWSKPYTAGPAITGSPVYHPVNNVISNTSFQSPVYIDGTNYTIMSSKINAGHIYSSGWLTLEGGSDVTGTLANPVMLCSEGDMTLKVIVKQAVIYCGGDLLFDGNSSENITIYCDGKVTLQRTSSKNLKVRCNEFVTTNGNIYNNSNGISVIYAENSISMRGTLEGLFYTNGSATIGSGSGLTGQLIARQNVEITGSFNFNKPSSDFFTKVGSSPFISGGSTSAITMPKVSDVIPSSSIKITES